MRLLNGPAPNTAATVNRAAPGEFDPPLPSRGRNETSKIHRLCRLDRLAVGAYLLSWRLKNRLFVVIQWVWSHLTYYRGARLIVNKELRAARTMKTNLEL